MKITPDVLRPHPLLALLPCRTLKRLIADSAVLEHPKGTVLIRKGEPCEALYLLISGRCESKNVGDNGRETTEAVYGPGDTLGERAFLNGEVHRCTVTVATHCVVLRIPAVELDGIFSKDPSIAGRFSRTVAKRLREIRERTAERGARVRRVAALLPLAPRLDSGIVMQQLSASLCNITKQEVLVLHLLPRNGTRKCSWMKDVLCLDGSFAFAQQVRTNQAGFDEVYVTSGGDRADVAGIAPLISHCGCRYDYVLLNLAPDLPEPALIEAMIQTDLAYVMLEPGMSCLYNFELLVRALTDRAENAPSHVRPIVFVEQPIAVEEFHDIFKHLGHTVHSFARGFPVSAAPSVPDRRFALHINRLAREIARCRVGLALSSGGAKGLAHVGVIQILEEHGIEIDAISGASMGAYVGALWAMGLDGDQLEKIALEHEGRWGLCPLLDPVLPPRRGFIRTRRIAQRLRRHLGSTQFTDLVRPMRIVATHLETLERVVFSTGDIVSSIEASIAIPGICVPVTIDDEEYVDGGVADPLPVDVLEEMGIERIIAVNAIPTPDRLRYWLEREREETGRKPRRSVGAWINEHINIFAQGNLLDNMVQAFAGAQMTVADVASRRADVVLRPVAANAWWCDFIQPRKYIELGRTVAEAQISELLAIANQPSNETPPLPAKTMADPIALRAA